MKHVSSIAAAISACLLTGSMAMAQQTGTTPQTDRGTMPRTDAADSSNTRSADASGMRQSRMSSAEFVKKAAADGMAEVEAGKVGVQKATNPEVKAFAQKMVTDHTKTNNELTALAKSQNLEVPSGPGLMQKASMERLEHEKAGAGFDHAFMKHMVSDHEKAVELFKQASTDTNIDPQLRSFAKTTLPALQTHLSQAQALESKLAKNQ